MARRRPQSLRAGLRTSRLSVAALFFMGIAAVTPLTVIVGGLSLGFGQIKMLGTPAGYLTAALVLAGFAVGVAAMARHVPNSGAFYSYVTAGLGRPLGVSTAAIALVSYNAIQIGLFGLFGVAATAALTAFGLPGWWSLCAVLGWAVIAVLGQLKIRTNARILGLLICAEILLVVVLDSVMTAHPADGITFEALNPLLLANPTGIASLVGAITGLVGFEVPLAFAPLAIDPRRTVRRAITWILAAVAVLYAGSGWAMTVVAGPDNIIGIAGNHLDDLFFFLSAPYLPGWVITLGMVLFATSLFAAMLAFHSTVARYTLTLAREGVLPKWMAFTRADEVPVTASVSQSVLALLVLLIAVLADLDPTQDLFFFGTVSGGLGVVIMMSLTAIAVIRYFHRNRADENWWRRRGAPIISAVLLTVILLVSIAFFGDLLGSTNPLKVWAPPVIYLVVAVLGILWAGRLRRRRPDVYAYIGHGDRTDVAPPVAAVVPADTPDRDRDTPDSGGRHVAQRGG